ncbi:hypothetical protein SU32_13145 [Ahrensia marina]|uniref:Uncharacterized protein n=1 Tax=Ahrensia marina TaxID=1514904 RepID=A0A0M9GLI3_9HYPH|nr:hypothetical protein SU32_13145 [Ahrensia marina]
MILCISELEPSGAYWSKNSKLSSLKQAGLTLGIKCYSGGIAAAYTFQSMIIMPCPEDGGRGANNLRQK